MTDSYDSRVSPYNPTLPAGSPLSTAYDGSGGDVGSNGPIFKIGAGKTNKVTRAGTLRLAIGMNPSYIAHAYPGSYKVRVRVK